jgi:DNA processing protein
VTKLAVIQIISVNMENLNIISDILALLSVRGIGPVMVNSCLLEYSSISHMISLNNNPLSKEQKEQYFEEREKANIIIRQLESSDVGFISALDDKYPKLLKKRLGRNTPPLLMFRGKSFLFDKRSVGFCGSRKASIKGLETARDCADQLASHYKLNVISGYAAGVDMETHKAALECGGTTVIVLAEGISHFRIKKEIKDIWDWDRIVVLSEFLPGVPWSVRNAMQRNKTICSLSGAMILIEAGETGGSVTAGKECLKAGIPLFASVYDGMPDSSAGNRLLIKQGANELYKRSISGRANLEPVFEAIKKLETTDNIETNSHKKGQKGQLDLF